MKKITDLTKSDVRHYVRDHFYSSDTFFGQRTPDEIPLIEIYKNLQAVEFE